MENGDELQGLSTKLNLMQHDVAVNKQITERNRTLVQNVRATARVTIRKLRFDVNTFFNNLESAVDKKIENMRSDDFHKITILSTECGALSDKIHSLSKDIDESVKAGKPCKQIEDMEKVRKEMQDLETSIRKLSCDNNVQEYTFQPATTITDLLKHTKAFGKLVVESEKKGTIIHMSELKLNEKCEDEHVIPFLSGLAFVSDDHLVAADYENRCLKCMSVTEDKILSVLPMNTEPWGIAAIGNNEIAATLPLQKKIHIIHVENITLSKGREFRVRGDCRGIDYRNGQLFVSFVDPAKIEILGKDGSVFKCFQYDQFGNELFRWPGYIAVSPDDIGSASIYVSDKDHNTVTRLSMEGKIETVYSGVNLKGPRGISIDNNGHVFVCGRASNELCQILLSSGKVEFLLERGQGLKSPHGIVCHGNRVYLSCCGDKMIKSWEVV